MGSLGAQGRNLELRRQRYEDTSLTIAQLISSIEDADVGELALQLQNEQVQLQAIIATGALAVQNTLLDFLR
jgi:flagellar hook-associated protein 3 FlgL